MKSYANLAGAILLAVLSIAPLNQSRAALIVTNGDFQDLTGLTPVNATWWNGVPTGWSGVNGTFTIRQLDPVPSGDYAANLNTLSTTTPSFEALRQAVGTLDSTGIITLSFDVVALNANAFNMSFGIFNTQNSANYVDWTLLALPPGGVTTTGFQTLSTAVAVGAGTKIGVAFWASAGAPGVDNVSVTAIPEPGTWVAGALLAGAAALARWRKRVIITP